MNLMESLFDYRKLLQDRNTRIYIAVFILGIVGVGGYYAYSWHSNNVQKLAQKAFSESLEVYKQALSLDFAKEVPEKDRQNLWAEAEIAFKTGYQQNKSSTLAPFFLAYEAQALLKQNKLDQAYEALSDGLKKIPSSSPFSYLYQVTQALIEIDKQDVQKGVDSLEKLTKDKNNPLKDMAVFYLGEYYLSNNEIAKARLQFESLDSMKTDAKQDSPWVTLAKARLQQLA